MRGTHEAHKMCIRHLSNKAGSAKLSFTEAVRTQQCQEVSDDGKRGNV